jgi:glutamine---fructose-6-phosphate transaminase (isomerizing)
MDTSSHLVREMIDTGEVVANIDVDTISAWISHATRSRVLFTGEGSSRIFPSKNLRFDAMRFAYTNQLQSEGATQAMEYDLSEYTVFAASNSGRTKEVVRLLAALQRDNHGELLALTAGEQSPLEENADATYHLISGTELAVAATKTVVEQALVYDIAFRLRNNRALPELTLLSEQFVQAFQTDVSDEMRSAIAGAGTIYWAGRNNGVAEELTLKTNEITRKPADYLEGTYAVHGIEEIMDSGDVVILIRPFADEVDKFVDVLVKGVGLKVIAIDSRPTPFPTLLIPDNEETSAYLELAAGWDLLVHAGLDLGVDLDKPERARKVGNEVD